MKPLTRKKIDRQRLNRPLVGASSLLPMYHRVALALRERIVTGQYPPEHVLPTDADLMMTFGVSRATMQRALNTLISEGHLTRSCGRCTVVTQKAAPREVGKPVS